MAMVLQNAILCDLDPGRVESGSLRIEGTAIAERGVHVVGKPHDEVVDCEGCVVLPGLVNGHTHLYSALAVGMPPPPKTPHHFLEILEYVWWRLDRALDAESIEVSARIGALEALRRGTTTLIDHHASPNCIDGSLDRIERGIDAVGLRGVLCYETTDRHGAEGCAAGIAENRRYLKRCARRSSGRFAGLVGGHASFTLEDESLDRLAALTDEFDTGVHIHVAEDRCDEEDARKNRGAALMDRLIEHGILKEKSIFAHGTHLTADAIERLNECGATLAHNARSNMNNAVGYAPVDAFRGPVMLGTDGIGGDLFAEAKAAWFASRDHHANLTPARVLKMLAASARRASAALGITLGKLEVGAAADIVVTDYRPSTPLSADNLAGHLLFGMSSGDVATVILAGAAVLRDREVIHRDLVADRNEAIEVAQRLWGRMAELPLE
ncbi:MAG: amidohydrolase family protein [Planctomycetes bacterium]|nr:amidohydrolase family protein [Planctomycetota bacterium]